MTDTRALVADLDAEGRDLAVLVEWLPEADWTTPTPSPGWDVAHQIAHLAWTDDVALVAVLDPENFAPISEAAKVAGPRYVDDAADQGAAQPPVQLLATWTAGRARLARALEQVPDGTKVPWFGPPMSAASMATARLMETWAHGLDVADGLGVERAPTDRLRHIAHLGVRTRDFAFVQNRLTPPADPFRVALRGPDGSTWTWGPSDAAQTVSGSALDFCLLATQRRNLADLDLVAVGADAQRWLTIAQAFAGSPGRGREPA